MVVSCSKNRQHIYEDWPFRDANVQVRESHYLDLGLRILAVELTQQAHEEKVYHLEFLPRLGKIEGKVVFTKKGRFSSKKFDRSFFKKQIQWETKVLLAGIGDLISGLNAEKGFSQKKHVQIRFQLQGANPLELALYNKGEFQWLFLSEKGIKRKTKNL